jgi:hypothetical protein
MRTDATTDAGTTMNGAHGAPYKFCADDRERLPRVFA